MEDKWEIWHEFDRASKYGFLEPLYCPNDGFQLYLQANSDDEPVLHCYQCRGTMEPGSKVTAQIKAQLESLHHRHSV